MVAISYQLLLAALFTSALLFTTVGFPATASADVLSIRTQQLLPPGAHACQQLVADEFKPYIYDNALNSFEFTVHDPSYVALIASVGNQSIPFQFLNRSFDAAGNVHIRVNMYSTPIRGTLPLTVTLLSAPGAGAPVCVSVVGMNVGSGPVMTQNAPTSAPTYEQALAPGKSYTPSTTQKPTPSAGATPGPAAPTSTIFVPPAVSVAPITTVAQNPLATICSSAASAYRLWLILLVVYALIVGAALWAEFPMSMPWAKTPERIATIILVLLLLLLAFWYFAPSCRAALWMPLLAFLIAILGLLAAFWNHPRVTQLLLIEESNL